MASTNRDEISRLELLYAAHPDGLVFPHLADAYRRAGRYAQAESVLNAGLRHHSDFSSAHVVLGRLRLDQGKRREAENAFRRVLQLDPENPVALELLGRLAAEEGRTDEALAHFRRLATVKPSEELGDRITALERQLRETEQARASSASASARAAGPAEGRRSTVRPRGNGGADRGESGSDAALPPGLPEPGEVVTETMAELYTRQGLHDRAEAVYRQLAARAPDDMRLRRKLEEVAARRRADAKPGRGAARPAERERPRTREPEALGRVTGDPERRLEDATGHDAAEGPGIRSYLAGVLAWKPSPPAEPADDLSELEPWAEAPVSEPGTSSPGSEPAEERPEPVREAAGRNWPGATASDLGLVEDELEGADGRTRALIALTDMLVGLLEYRDPFFRGSSSLTRLLAMNVANEMGLNEVDRVNLALAAVLRDLGRLAMGGRLVESQEMWRASVARQKIERHVDLALQLMEGIELPRAVMLAVRHHHERWDGAGYPDGLAGEDIPMLARVLAAVDSFAAMVSPRPYRLPRKVPDAARELQDASGSQYDPEVVTALLRVLDRRDQPNLGFVQRHHILLVNPDQPGAVVTAAKLCTSGYLAEVAVDGDAARERLRRVPVAALVVSAQAGADAATDLIRDLRLDPLFASLPIVVVEAESAALRVQLLESGADVCFPPGISYGELQGTLGALVRRTLRSRERRPESDDEEAPWLALQGDIQDFPLAWLLQVMKYDSRTAGIGIRTATEQGAVYIEKGDAVHAQIRGADRGESALKDMLQWRKGRFTVQPEARSKERSIESSIMHLLLTQAVEEDHAAAGVFGAVTDHG